MSSTEPKTEPASAKKIRDALKKGNRPKSILVGNAIGTVVWMIAGYLGWNLIMSLIWPLTVRSMEWDLADHQNGMVRSLVAAFIPIFLISAASLVLTMFTAIASLGATHGELAPAPEAVAPKFEKFNPATNAKNLFSLKQLYQLIKNVVYVIVLAWVTWLVGKYYVGASLALYRSGSTAIQVAAPYAIMLAFAVGLGVTFAFAVIDRTAEKLLWLKDLKMTKSEVKREYEEQNGNPHIKAQRMSTARQAATAARGDAEKYGNLICYSMPDSKIIVMHTNDSFKRPLVLWKEKGVEADTLATSLRSIGAEMVENSYATDMLYPKAQPGDFLNGSSNELLTHYRHE
jgi:flagellar biosynthesis protein FlhB